MARGVSRAQLTLKPMAFVGIPECLKLDVLPAKGFAKNVASDTDRIR